MTRGTIVFILKKRYNIPISLSYRQEEAFVMNKKCIFIIFAACILVLGACFSAWRGDEGTISISIGGGEAVGRAAAGTTGGAATDGDGEFSWPDEVFHTITFSGGSGPGPNQSGIKGGKTVHFSVAPGQWTITIEAFYTNKEDSTKGVIGPLAEGSRTVNIKSGPNGTVVIPMSIKVIDDDDDTNSGKAGTLRWAIQDVVQMSKKNIDIVIDLPEGDNEIILKGTLPDIEGKSVTIRAKKDVTIKRFSNNFIASFFTIGEGGTLILDGPITIDGGNQDNPSIDSPIAPLITINGGAFIMNKDVTLQNNTNNNGKGGGVSVDGNGTFTMNNGTISGNKAITTTATDDSKGGGVYVLNGTFTMKGGTIKGNIAAASGTPLPAEGYGGGVYVDDNGKFIKTGGTINGVDDPSLSTVSPDANTTQPSGQGNAVFVTEKTDPTDATIVVRIGNKKDTTIGPTDNLDSETTDEWDN